MPSFASGAYNPLIYPPDWPLALLQKVLPLPELTWMLLYYFLGGLFARSCSRASGARARGRAARRGGVRVRAQPGRGGIARPRQPARGLGLPAAAAVARGALDAARQPRRSRRWLALAGGFQMLRGHVQICFYTWLAVGALRA